jgi:hypothetical protein
LRVRYRFHMNRDRIAASRHILIEVGARVCNHQVSIKWRPRQRAEAFNHHRAIGQIRNEMTIHDIQMQDLSTGGVEQFDFTSQVAKVTLQHRRRHDRSLRMEMVNQRGTRPHTVQPSETSPDCCRMPPSSGACNALIRVM